MKELPKLRKGDWVKMWFPFCQNSLYVQFLTYDNDMPDREKNPGFVYFHPLTGETAAYYLNNITAVKRKNKQIFAREPK